MRRLVGLLVLALAVVFSGSAFAQDSLQVQNRAKNKEQVKSQQMLKVNHSKRFVDEDGDGYNDNAPDHDGDGIPNGQDPDYDGSQARKGNGKGGFVDEDGDGINDNAMDADGDGTPNGQDPDYVRPEDGTGLKNQYGRESRNQDGRPGGPGNATGSGECDGTGPKGSGKRGGQGKK